MQNPNYARATVAWVGLWAPSGTGGRGAGNTASRRGELGSVYSRDLGAQGPGLWDQHAQGRAARCAGERHGPCAGEQGPEGAARRERDGNERVTRETVGILTLILRTMESH